MTEAYIEKTQAELGAIISAPKLSEKLLGKPPFRFLHDIVCAFIKTTNFPAGYYSDDMLDSAKVSDKESKLEFLIKLVNVVQAATGKTTSCKPAKTIAGQEPEGTNDLLQLLAACAALSQADKDKAVRKALGGGKEPDPPKEEKPAEDKDAKAKEDRDREKKERDARKDKERKEKERREKEEAEAKAGDRDEAGSPPPEEEEPKKEEKKDKHSRDKKDKKDKHSKDAVQQPTKLGGATTTSRPSTATARKPPPSIKTNVEEENPSVEVKEVAPVIKEEKKDKKKASDDAEEGKDWMQLVEEHEAAARSHAHSGTEEARGYLGKGAIEARKKQQEEKEAEERGAGVEGLILKSHKSKDKHGSSVGDSELSRLKEQLQMLTKATNPLGKFLEAIHEDMDTMSRELEMWKTEALTQTTAANEAHRQTEESLHSVYGRIQNIEDSISDQLVRTSILRSNILANDKTIDTMVKMVVAPDTNTKRK